MQIVNFAIILALSGIVVILVGTVLLRHSYFKVHWKLFSIAAYLFVSLVLIFLSSFWPAGSAFYKEKQAKIFYSRHNHELKDIVKGLDSLSHKGLYSIFKNRNGIQVLIGQQELTYDIEDPALKKAIRTYGIDSLALAALIAEFRKLKVNSIGSRSNWIIIQVTAVLPLQTVNIIFCLDNKDCIKYEPYKRIDNGVYYVRYSDA